MERRTQGDDPEDPFYYVVMHEPEGNEFCVSGDADLWAHRPSRADVDLSGFADGTFGLVFHPVSNLFVPDVTSIWRECFRVLRPGGTLLAGFLNPRPVPLRLRCAG